jgi:preprotein translocase subunit SecE
MALQAAAQPTSSRAERIGAFFRGIPAFFRDVTAELRKVTWPDRAQVIDATWRIIVFVLFIAAVIGLLDVLLQAILVQWLPKIFAGGR